MSSLKDVFRVLTEMRDSGVVTNYAIGATAVLFYAEPTRTCDVDVFVTLPTGSPGDLLSLSSAYDWARSRGIAIESEHLMIEGVPVQLLPAYNPLVEEAVAAARVHDYEGVPVRVVGPEHLIALALQAGGARRRERAWQLLQFGGVDRQRLRAVLDRHAVAAEIRTMSEHVRDEAVALFERKLAWHEGQARLPLREKFRILIELQRQDLPLLARRRSLQPWERPWEITP